MTAISGLTARDLLESLPEPSFVLDTSARVLASNRAAVTRFGSLAGFVLTSLASPADAAELETFIRRCSGSRGPIPDTTTLRNADGATMRFRCLGSLLAPARDDAPAMVLLRLSEAADERFLALARDVRRLNVELGERRRIQAALEEALRDRELMLRELHHRVKNNIQMLVGMISSVRRESTSPEVHAVLAQVANRLEAIGAVHRMLHHTDSLDGIDAARFAADLSGAILRASSTETQFSTRATVGTTIPNDVATPLALILNELIINAIKHVVRGGEIHVDLSYSGCSFEVSVEDNGPGFDLAEPAKRASGLGLVRGLARQLGGDFVVERRQGGGARCTVRFGLPSDDHAARELAM